MLWMAPIKSLLSPRHELTAQGAAQHTNVQSYVWHHSAIQAPIQYLASIWKESQNQYSSRVKKRQKYPKNG